jgi:hypothetical protein
MLKGCLKMYKDLDFKRAVAKAENNVTLKMQLTRLGTNVEIDIEGVTFLFTLKNNSKSHCLVCIK